MQGSAYILPSKYAGSDEISQELYSHQHIDQKTLVELISALRGAAGGHTDQKILLLGGRTGLTTEILLSFASHIDVVEENQYKDILVQRFEKGKDVDQIFGREGELGQKFVLLKPELKGKTVRVISTEQFLGKTGNAYDLIVLQNVIYNGQINLAKQLIKVPHKNLITMIVPGRILNKPFFPFIKSLEKTIIMKYYQAIFHQRITSKKFITGRRQQVFIYEVFGWIKNTQEQATREELETLLDQANDACEKINSQKKLESVGNPYETQQLVEMYLGFHFGPDQLNIQNYPSACAKLCIKVASEFGIKGRALDLGCAVGRTTIDLVHYFDQAVGLDFSSAFIKSANEVLNQNFADISGKVKFVVGDACNLDPALGKFNLVFGGNLVDRLPIPLSFINSVGNFLNKDGILILTSPYSWLEEYTSKDKWLGGYIKEGKQVTTQQGLLQSLVPNGFKQLKDSENIRFVIKQNDWVFQYTLANATFWQKL